jgi:hypothetical protein
MPVEERSAANAGQAPRSDFGSGWASLFDQQVPVGHSILTKTKDGDAASGDRKDKGWSAAMSAGKAADWFATRRDNGQATRRFPLW